MKYIDRILIIVFFISLLIAIKTQKENLIVFTITIGICVSYIFYLLVEFIPRKLRIYRAKKILSQQIHWFLYELFVLIHQIMYVFDIKKRIEDLEEKDFLHINGDTSKKINVRYETGEYWNCFWKKNKRFSGFGNMSFEYPKSIVETLSKIPKSIDEIKQTYPLYYNDEVLAEILSSIQTSKVIKNYSDGRNPLFLFAHSSSDLFPLIQGYKRLKSLKYHIKYKNTYHTINFLTLEEAELKYNQNLSKKEEISPTSVMYYILKPVIIFNPQYKDSRAMITGLNDGWLVSNDGTRNKMFKALEYADIDKVEESKCIVILEDKIPKKDVIEYIERNKNEKIIIRLISKFFFTTKSDKYKNVNTSFGVYKVYYRKPISFMGIRFFSKYPTWNHISKINSVIYDIKKNAFASVSRDITK